MMIVKQIININFDKIILMYMETEYLIYKDEICKPKFEPLFKTGITFNLKGD